MLQVDDMEGQSTSERFVVEKYKGGTNQIAAEYIIRVGRINHNYSTITCIVK